MDDAELEIKTASTFHRGQLPWSFDTGEKTQMDGYLEFSRIAKNPDVSENVRILKRWLSFFVFFLRMYKPN